MRQTQLIEFKAGDSVSGDFSGAIGVFEAVSAQQVIKIVQESQLSHLVQKTGLAYDTELALANSMSRNLEQFLNDPLPLILGSNDAAYPSLVVKCRAEEPKNKTLESFEEFMKSLRGTRKIREPALMMADELYTNAAKNGGYHSKLRLASQEQRPGLVEFFASADDTRLVFGCRDSYGELGFGKVLNRINECFEKGIAQSINNGEGGAGIGSFMVFNSCISYYCGVEKGKRTVVCVALPLGGSPEELESLPKNVHLRAAG